MQKVDTHSLCSHIPEEALKFVSMSGSDIADRIGYKDLRKIVAGVLCGENIRAATEPLTRRRISALNAAVLITMHSASKVMSAAELLKNAEMEFKKLPSSDPKKKILMWILGLTGKQVQNVLRSNESAWKEYLEAADVALTDSVNDSEKLYGTIDISIFTNGSKSLMGWQWTHSLMTAIGTQTLATRGAEKSMYGKYFEKLILASVLDILGFSYDGGKHGNPMTFWLSDRGEKRESDATAIIGEGSGVRFDIGFIGPGNTEVSLDKVSRYTRIDDISGKQFDLSTIIIVDRIGKGSRIEELAKAIDGRILQMSSSLWAKTLDSELSKMFSDYASKFDSNASVKEVRDRIDSCISEKNIRMILKSA